MSTISYLPKVARAFIEALFAFPLHFYKDSQRYSKKQGKLLRLAVSDTFPNENPMLRYTRSLYEGLDGGKPEITRTLARRLGNSLYPHGFTEAQIAVLTTLCYKGLSHRQNRLPTWRIRVHNGLSGTFDVSEEEVAQALNWLVKTGYIVEHDKDYRLTRKIDDLLV